MFLKKFKLHLSQRVKKVFFTKTLTLIFVCIWNYCCLKQKLQITQQIVSYLDLTQKNDIAIFYVNFIKGLKKKNLN